MSQEDKIQSYKDLIVWKKAHELVLLTYRLTSSFPSSERFELTSQMRRAGISITANIAEGYGRFSNKDREHFFVMAQGSIYELDSHYQIALDLKFLSIEHHRLASELVLDVIKLLAALLKAHRSRS